MGVVAPGEREREKKKEIAIPLQQWLPERASMLRYTYMTCLFMIPYI